MGQSDLQGRTLTGERSEARCEEESSVTSWEKLHLCREWRYNGPGARGRAWWVFEDPAKSPQKEETIFGHWMCEVSLTPDPRIQSQHFSLTLLPSPLFPRRAPWCSWSAPCGKERLRACPRYDGGNWHLTNVFFLLKIAGRKKQNDFVGWDFLVLKEV